MEKLIVRWTRKDKEFCNLLDKKDLQKKINKLRRDYPYGYQEYIDKISDIIIAVSSIYFDIKDNSQYVIPKLEFYFSDGNASSENLINDYAIENLIKVIFDVKNENKIFIPETYSLKYINGGKMHIKEISRKDVRDIFEKYVEADALNNGISKKIVAINNYAKELFINFDNAVEINSLYYKTYFEEIETAGIPIPYIHRIMWSCIRKLCDME